MRNLTLLLVCFIAAISTNAQSIHDRLDEKVKHLLADAQMKHAIMGLYVVNSKTGKVVYDLNGEVGLAPASTQKIFTSIAALDTLGSHYRYKTEIGYSGSISDSTLTGNLVMVGYGDPSLGSWRYPNTKMEQVLRNITAAVKAAGINKITGNIVLDDSKFSYQPVPGGWPWADVGNYYGSGTWGINWNENQYDLMLNPGETEGSVVSVAGTNPPLIPILNNLVTTGPKGSGDNTNIYLAPYATSGLVGGTAPAGEKNFVVSGSIPYPADVLGKALVNELNGAGIKLQGTVVTGYKLFCDKQAVPGFGTTLLSMRSPSLDSLAYWFLQKSINFYGETFARTIAFENTGIGSTEKGVDIIRNYWLSKGIEKSSIKIIDGSGLSPQNRVTAAAEVAALQYAKTAAWFNSFYNSLPTYNGTKMKSGTIGGVKAYAGYQNAANGNQYTFSIIINNYDGSVESVIQKMYKVLDVLK